MASKGISIALKLAKGIFVDELKETVKNKDSKKAQRLKGVVTEVRDACDQFLEVFEEGKG